MAPDEPARSFRALLIGNSTFPDDPHNLLDLNGPVNDLAVVRDVLTDPEVGLFGQDDVRLLPERTKREVATAMEQFFGSASRDEQLLLYYSGHGMQDTYGNLYLCVRDTRTDLLVSTGVSDVEINGMMRTSSAKTFVVILDCCHSGGFKDGGLPTNLRGSGRFLLTSSRRGELSTDTPQTTGPSAFTRHLVDGLRTSSLDVNGDGFVSLNEAYDYVLNKLQADTKQIPQRHLDNVIGDVPLARARRSMPSPPPPPTTERPLLEVSETTIDLRDVQPGERLPTEIIDVFNRGGGSLDWTVQSNAPWITVEPEATFFKMSLHPKPGPNRGTVQVRDKNGGGTRTVRVSVRVLERRLQPELALSAEELDFGTLSFNTESPERTVQILNSGGGELRAEATTTDPWIHVRQVGDTVNVVIDTDRVGRLVGEISVRSDGGEGQIRVTAIVERGPVLSVEPDLIDFGRLWAGTEAVCHVKVGNAGQGALQWNGGASGDFFTVERTDEGLLVRLLAGRPGIHAGSIWIQSNGGQATIDIRADLVAPQAPKPVVKQIAVPSTTPPMKTYLPLALVSAFTGICSFVGWIPGVIAVVFAARANNFRAEGDLARALKAATAARVLAWVTLAINIPVALLVAVSAIGAPA